MCSAASSEVNVPDVQVTKAARHGSKRSIGNDSDLDPLFTGPVTTSTVTVTTTADNSPSGSDSSRQRMARGQQPAIGNNGGANHNNNGTSSSFSALSPTRQQQQQQQQQQHVSRHSRRVSGLAAEAAAAEVGANCFPNPAGTLSILGIQPQQTATSLDTDTRCMGEASDMDGHCDATTSFGATGENSALLSSFYPPLSSPSTPMPLCPRPPLPPPPLLPAGAPPCRRHHHHRFFHANHESPQPDYPRHLVGLSEGPAVVATARGSSSHSHSPHPSPVYQVRPALLESSLSAMSCITTPSAVESVGGTAAATVAPVSGTLAGGSILAANGACNPSPLVPLGASPHSPLASPLVSAKPTLPHYSVSTCLPPRTTATPATTAALLRPPSPPLQLFVAHIPGGNGAAVDLDIDIDIDMDEDVRSGSDQDDGSGDRRPVLSSGLHAEAATAPGGSRQLLHGHSLSDSQISPIRSSTALALSPSQAADLSSVAATQLDRPLLDARLQQLLLLRVNEIQRFCDTLLQVQVQHESKIRSLEATVRRFSDVSSPLSSHQLTPTTATAVGPASAAMHLVSAAVSPPLHHHYHQHQHQREMMAPPLAGSPSGRSDLRRAHHLPTIQAPMSIPPILPKTIRRSSDAIPTADDMAARQQYLDPMLPPPQPAAAYQQSHSAFAAVGSERKAPAQMSTGMNQQHGSLPPLSLAAPQHTRHYPQPQASAPSIRHQQAYHRGASSSFCGGSDYVSPKLARKMSPPPTLPSLAAVGGSQAHSQRHHHRSLGSGGGSRPQHAHHVSGGSRRGSVALAMSAEGDRGAASGLYSAAGGDARLQQQRQFLPPFSAPSSASSRRASVGPSAFGYPAVAAPAGGATAADIGQHYGGGQAGAPPSHPPALHAPGYPSMVRTKRPRDAESGDELIGEGPGLSAPGGEAATLSHMQPPHLHLARHSHPAYAPHHQHTMLPPIRTSEGSQHITSPGLARPATGASLHLVSPSAIAFAPSGHTEDKDKGKGVASELVVSDSIGITQAARSGRDAQPTQSWLASQRHYKTALLHLLSLESFYPSDMAMLNMFRALGDFTPEQVEVHSSTLLSWARGWLRYSRNAVIRSTLDNKAREPIKQLAETLQHDLHTDVDFTTPENLRRCTLLRLIYFQWQAAGKLGSKSNSIYRDYESRLREIEALPTVEDQERDWEEILREEQKLRLDIIREARVRSGESAIQPRVRVRPEQMYQSRIQMNVAPPSSQHPVSAPLLPPPPMSSMAIGQPSLELAHGTSAMQQLSLSRRQSADYLVSAQSPTPGPSHHYPQQQQHYQGPPLPSPAHLHFRQQYQQAQHPPPPQQYPRSLSYRHHHQSQVQQMHPHYRSRELPMREPDGSGAQPEGMDNESDLSVNLSPEP